MREFAVCPYSIDASKTSSLLQSDIQEMQTAQTKLWNALESKRWPDLQHLHSETFTAEVRKSSSRKLHASMINEHHAESCYILHLQFAHPATWKAWKQVSKVERYSLNV